jgi:hypothetical protein
VYSFDQAKAAHWTMGFLSSSTAYAAYKLNDQRQRQRFLHNRFKNLGKYQKGKLVD